MTFEGHLVQTSANSSKQLEKLYVPIYFKNICISIANYHLVTNFKSCFSCPVFVSITQELEYSPSTPLNKSVWLESGCQTTVLCQLIRVIWLHSFILPCKLSLISGFSAKHLSGIL